MSNKQQNSFDEITARLKKSPKAIALLVAIIILSGTLTQVEMFSSSFAPKIVGAFMGLAIIALMLLFVKTLRPQAEVSDTDSAFEQVPTKAPNTLTRLVKGYTDVIWFLLLGLAILLPFIGAIVSIDYFEGQTGRWGVDLNTFWGFTIDLSQLTNLAGSTQGLRSEVISGKSMLDIETVSVKAWYIFIAINEVMLLLSLYALAQMRRIFASLVKGVYFTIENAVRIQKIGIIIIVGNVIVPLMQYFGGRAMLDDIAVNIAGIDIYPAFQVGMDGIFIGVALLLLSGVAREAANIYEEQLGTI